MKTVKELKEFLKHFDDDHLIYVSQGSVKATVKEMTSEILQKQIESGLVYEYNDEFAQDPQYKEISGLVFYD